MIENKSHILLIEDEHVFAKAVCTRIDKAGFHCSIAGTLEAARQHCKTTSPDLILLDMRLPDGSGLEFLSELRTGGCKETAVIVMTAFGGLDDAVAAMKLKALDYLQKPVDLEELLSSIKKVLERPKTLPQKILVHAEEENTNSAIKMIGESAAIEKLRKEINHVATLTAKTSSAPPTVLILGETGTGKDVTARQLHQQSQRHDKPFIQVDCASLPKDLVEAELFGHEKGAFTSASGSRVGLIEAARDGTLFLDEIAELPLELQAKLLAVLERRVYRRLGSVQEHPVNAWIIAATNRPIKGKVALGEFRADLYYRLRVLNFWIPPLRERQCDIKLLAQFFIERTLQQFNLERTQLSEQALHQLEHYSWPGNVRELLNVIERSVLLCKGAIIDRDTLDIEELPATSPNPISPPKSNSLNHAEQALILDALGNCKGNVSKAARKLGITRMTLRYRMQKHSIQASNA